MLGNVEFGGMLEECRKNGGLNAGILKEVESIARAVLVSRGLKRDVDDVCQNVLIRFSRLWKRIEPRNKPQAYVVKIIKTEAFRHNRKSINRKKFIIYESEFDERSSGFGSLAKFSLGEVRAVDC